jgi:hypothetical protein
MTIPVRSVRPGPLRRRRVRLGVGVIAAAALALAGATPALAAPAAASRRVSVARVMARLDHGVTVKSAQSQDLQSSVTQVTTTTGAKLDVSFSATRVPGSPQLGLSRMTLDTTEGTEGHLWSFPIGTTAFTTTSSGAGSFKTGAAFGAYGSVSVTFTPTASRRIDVCDPYDYTVRQTERMKGKLYFDTRSTGSHAWGKVGSTRRSFAFKGQTYLFTTYVGDECLPIMNVGACYNQVTWTASNKSQTINFSGSTGPGDGSISADRVVHLKTPKGASRLDLVLASAPNPVLSTSGETGTEKVKTSGGTFRGSATIKGPKASVSIGHCTTGTLTETDWVSATTYKASPALRAHEEIFGTIKLPPTKVKSAIYEVKTNHS